MTAIVLSLFSMLFGLADVGRTFISGIFAVIYGLFLIFDTQMVLGKGQYSLSVDDYVVGAMIIYMDIMMLFLELLKIFGDRS